MFTAGEGSDQKMLRSFDVGQVFGKKDATNERQDIAKAAGETTVLAIDRVAYDRIRAETVQSDAEQKIEYLIRYVPKLRMSPRGIIEELDILFVKECYTKGYRIIKDGDFNENVYFIKSGACKLLQPLTGPLTAVKAQLTSDEQAKYKYVQMCTLGVGQAFGEETALNGGKSTEVIEAESDQVEAYRISKSMLLQYFGGSASEVIYAIRAGAQAKRNWIQMKLQQLGSAKKDDLLKAGLLCDETEYKSLKPVKTMPGEVPYLKMVQTYGKPSADSTPRSLKVGGVSPTAAATKVEEEKVGAEPVTSFKPPPAPKPTTRRPMMNTFMIEKAPNEEHKDDSIRGFGTMRLVASDRMKNITPQQMGGLVALRKIAQDVKSGGKKQDPKADFDKESVKNFQNKVMMADPAIAEKAKASAAGSGANFFKKMREFNAADLKAKLGQ